MLPNYSPDPTLTPEQHHVLALLAEGRSIQDAAAEAGVHRNTVRNWRRAVPAFAREIEFAVREQALVWHEQALQLAPQAAAILHKIFTDETTPLALQARTALAILKIAADPQPRPLRAMPTVAAEMEAAHGQILSWTKPAVQAAPTPPEPTPVHSGTSETSAQCRTIRRPPEPGRNSPCPCKSGQKFKRCCGSVLQSAIAAAGAA